LAFSPVGSVAVPRWGTPSTDRSDSVESCHGKAVTEGFWAESWEMQVLCWFVASWNLSPT